MTNREDVLDFVIKLEHIGDPGPCHFRASFDKTRHFDDGVDPTVAFAAVEAELVNGEWRQGDPQLTMLKAVVDMRQEKKSFREIAKALNVYIYRS